MTSQWWRRLSSIFSASLSSPDTTTDLDFLCSGGITVPAHRMVLGLASPLLAGLMAEEDERVTVILLDTQASSVRHLLGLVYRSHMPPGVKERQQVDCLAIRLGLRVRSSVCRSNIVFRDESGELYLEKQEGEQWLEEQQVLEEKTTFLYIEDVKDETLLTLDETENSGLIHTSEDKIPVEPPVIDFPPFHQLPFEPDQEMVTGEEEMVAGEDCEENIVTEDKVIVVPLGSNGGELVHETEVIVNSGARKLKKVSAARLAKIRHWQSSLCPVCTKPALAHRSKDPDRGSPNRFFYRCCYCSDLHLRTARALVSHMKTHVEPRCVSCARTRLEHAGGVNQEAGQVVCCVCGEGLPVGLFVRHMKGHSKKRRFNCKECDEKFSTPARLMSHMVSVHEGGQSELLRCHSCQFETTSKPSLRRHEIKVHGADSAPVQQPRMNCPSCGKSITRRHYEKHHRQACSREVVLRCHLCGREGFCNSTTLHDHIRARHTTERPFKCDLCGRGFPAASHLAHHRVKVHRVNSKGEAQPKQLFPCNHCGKVLTTKPKLLAHVKVVHQGIRDFECSICSKPFSSKSNLTIHLGSVHTGDLPYKCELCSKSFARKNLLSAHRQSKHQFIEAQSVHSQSL